ncbi:MAG: hypothetical protein KDK89_13005 [Alphaproteobacteria bacterium]|nr:hypothetical protein [Alphaproteobacteria bacterium]
MVRKLPAYGLASLVALAVSACTAGIVKADDTSAADDFRTFCAPCHGTGAKGDGPAGKALRVPPPDLTRIAQRHGGDFPEQAIFDVVAGLDMPDSHGSREMPIWGDRFVTDAVGTSLSLEEAHDAGVAAEARIRKLLDYLKSIQVKD